MKTWMPALVATTILISVAPATEAQVNPNNPEYKKLVDEFDKEMPGYKKMKEKYNKEQKLFDEHLTYCRGYLYQALLDAVEANKLPTENFIADHISNRQGYSTRGLLN